ncbi:MAG TPA: anti-sigma-D factor RsdA, partial [Mycobacterium sp.]|nr:anti-sigma-D factor RsdA [Mycobacterium sp.]
MSDFGRTPGNDDASLDAVLASDRLVDALAAGQSVPPRDQADAELFALLGGWRDEMRWPPANGLVTEQDAVTALQAGLAEKQGSGRSRRGLSVVGAVAAAVLGIGGFGAVVSGAGPGDALYGLRTMFFGAPKQVRTDQVALAAQTELNQVQDLIARGDWQAAQDKLVAVSTQVASVGDADQKQQLFDQWNQLSAKVVERNPEATVAPGITYTVPPSATELVPTPAATTVPNTPIPPITISTTPDSPSTGSSSPSPSPSEVTTSPSAPGSTSPEQTPPSTTPPPTSATPSPTSTP